MIIQCENCSRKFIVKDNDIPAKGRMVKCGYCSTTWHQIPISIQTKTVKSATKEDDSLSIDNIKASDGKTYRFLGTQWAELLSSGKTGLFAKKKIGLELDEITGRKKIKTTKKKKKKQEEINPSSSDYNNTKKLPDIYKGKQGLGFFGYIFLIIIVGFSIIGMLKTFEDDLVNYFPKIDYIFTLLDEQLIYLSESTKNIIVIISDLINSY